jgi:hypothetical protein
MERTMTTIIMVVFALLGMALIIAYLTDSMPRIRDGLCEPDQLCAGKTNGEAFCENGSMLVTCTLDAKACLKPVRQQCGCIVENGIAHCAP